MMAYIYQEMSISSLMTVQWKLKGVEAKLKHTVVI